MASRKDTAILVIDIQNDYCSPRGRAAKAGKKLSWLQKTVAKIEKFLLETQKLNIPTFFVKRVLEQSKLSGFEREKQKERGVSRICEKGSWGADFYRVKPRKKDKIIQKKGYSAFFQTGLHKQLQKMNIRNLIVVGGSTHICVDSTIRDAYQYGYHQIVPKELVATREEERNFHKMALLLFKKRFAEVVSVTEVVEFLKGSKQLGTIKPF